jgi:hypothetical protein
VQQVPTQVAALKSGSRRRPTPSRKPRSSVRSPTQWRTWNRSRKPSSRLRT